MRPLVVRQLILKDLYLHRWLIVTATLAGVVALPLGGSTGAASNVGMILFLTAIVALGIFVAMYGVLSERQSRSLIFLLSLPVSPMQYMTAKVIASLAAFLAPWSILTATTLVRITLFDTQPHGTIPFTIAMMLFMLAGFSALLALLLATRSEAWAVAGVLVTNIGVAAYMNFVPALPGIAETLELETPVWSPQVVTLITLEVAAAALSIALAFFIQSRRKDHV